MNSLLLLHLAREKVKTERMENPNENNTAEEKALVSLIERNFVNSERKGSAIVPISEIVESEQVFSSLPFYFGLTSRKRLW
jgi:hypothetical protein